MARPFTSRDANRLIDEHRELKTRLSKAEAYSDHCKASISKASEALVAQEVLNVLKDIPIDEINRDIEGKSNVASLVTGIDKGKRSYKVYFAPPLGISYAKDIAEKYGVTFEIIKENIEKQNIKIKE